jgi:hypothetical protein
MFTDQDLRELLEYQAEHPVLSVFLNTEPSQGNADAYRLRLRSMLKEVNLPDDQAAVEQFIQREYDWSGRSLAIFSCAPEGFFRSYSLAAPLRSRVRVNARPHVKPLVDLLDSYGGYGVALIDKQGARMFYFHLGELREQEGLMGEGVHHTKRGGGSQAHGRRGGTAGQTQYVEELAERNLRDAADFAAHFFSENNVRRVLIGGTEENIAYFRGQLPKSWQSLVVGAFPVAMTASHAEVLERAMRIGQEAERRREQRLAEAVVTGAAKGRGGVVGLEDTLAAAHQGRAQTLLYHDGYRAAGARCAGCGHLTTHPAEACPYCGGAYEAIPDAVELAVHRVLQSGGDIEVLHDDAVLDPAEPIAALLRY